MRPLFILLGLAASFPALLFAQQPQFETTEISAGVYQFRFQSHNGFFVVSDGGVVAFDPISTAAAERYAAEIQRVAPEKPLLAIVYSHHHADHATGGNVLAAAFDTDAPIIAHERARIELDRAADPDLPAPDLTFNEQLTLYLGGRQIDLYYVGLNHSDNSLVGIVPDVGVAFAVDFVSNDRVGYQDLGSFHLPELFDSLMRLRNLEFDTIVFGHGPPGDPATIDRQISYYNDLRTAVERAIRAGLTEDQSAAQIALRAYADWGGYEDWFTLNVRGMYRALSNDE